MLYLCNYTTPHKQSQDLSKWFKKFLKDKRKPNKKENIRHYFYNTILQKM